MSKVFVSYKRADMDKVFPLVREMESELGIKFWIDLEGIESDKQFGNEILNAISNCEVFLFMYSKFHENIDPENDYTLNELYHAKKKKIKHIVFLELEACKPDDIFFFFFPLKQVTKADDKEAISRLINDIRKWLNLPQPNTTPNDQGHSTDMKDPQIRPQSQSEARESSDPHPAVDLGLPSGTKWASCNVGASQPEEYGDYFAWGETEKKDIYHWSTYIHSDDYLYSDIAGTKYDVASIKWGGNWRMPTEEQFEELLENCRKKWMKLNGVEGRKFTSKINGNSIFLPAAGSRYDYYLRYAGIEGFYWSSTQDPSRANYAYSLYFLSSGWYMSYRSRAYGFSVRPVVRD